MIGRSIFLLTNCHILYIALTEHRETERCLAEKQPFRMGTILETEIRASYSAIQRQPYVAGIRGAQPVPL